jgi:hypothetical protein
MEETIKMKKKELKLTLNKQTISNLNNMEMGIIKGGTEGIEDTSSAHFSYCALINSKCMCLPVSPVCPTTTN